MDDLPCEYGKCPGGCTHPEAVFENKRSKPVFEPHCRSGICTWFEPNRDRLRTALLLAGKQKEINEK